MLKRKGRGAQTKWCFRADRICVCVSLPGVEPVARARPGIRLRVQ